MMEQIATSRDAVAAMMRDAKITDCPSGSPHPSVILPPPAAKPTLTTVLPVKYEISHLSLLGAG